MTTTLAQPHDESDSEGNGIIASGRELYYRLRKQNVTEQSDSSVCSDVKPQALFRQSSTAIRVKVKLSPRRCGRHIRDQSCGRRNHHRFSRRWKRKLHWDNNGQLLIIYTFSPSALDYFLFCLKFLICSSLLHWSMSLFYFIFVLNLISVWHLVTCQVLKRCRVDRLCSD